MVVVEEFLWMKLEVDCGSVSATCYVVKTLNQQLICYGN